MELSERCLIHADKMEGEGWYVTANVLAEAAERLKTIQSNVQTMLTALADWQAQDDAQGPMWSHKEYDALQDAIQNLKQSVGLNQAGKHNADDTR